MRGSPYTCSGTLWPEPPVRVTTFPDKTPTLWGGAASPLLASRGHCTQRSIPRKGGEGEEKTNAGLPPDTSSWRPSSPWCSRSHCPTPLPSSIWGPGQMGIHSSELWMMQEQALLRLKLADGDRCSWEPRGPAEAPCPALPTGLFSQALRHFPKKVGGAGIKVLDYTSAGRRGRRKGKQQGHVSAPWTPHR